MIRRNFIKTAVAACLAPLVPSGVKAAAEEDLWTRRLHGANWSGKSQGPFVVRITHNVSGVALNPRKHIVLK